MPLDSRGTYLYPNVIDVDGQPGYLHPALEDAPLTVSVGPPRSPPRYGSRKQARLAVIGAMCVWESHIRRSLPDFRMRFVDPETPAAVTVEWPRRAMGAAGRATYRVRVRNGFLEYGGWMSVFADSEQRTALTVDETRTIAAHEFGHVLGLFHCLECDSIMNYSFETRDRLLVSPTDSRTLRALLTRKNGYRLDGRPLQFLQRMGWEPGKPRATPRVVPAGEECPN